MKGREGESEAKRRRTLRAARAVKLIQDSFLSPAGRCLRTRKLLLFETKTLARAICELFTEMRDVSESGNHSRSRDESPRRDAEESERERKRASAIFVVLLWTRRRVPLISMILFKMAHNFSGMPILKP